MNRQQQREREPLATGIDGLDVVLGGGLTANRIYLVEGVPGAGKTTLALQFLLEGLRQGETVLYVTLSETEHELREVAASHGWSLDGVHIHELQPPDDQLDPDDQYTMFHPSEVELGRTTRRILDEVERLKPGRVVFDSLAELRLLAGSALRFRRQVLALKQYFAGRGSTVLLLALKKRTVAHERTIRELIICGGGLSISEPVPQFRGIMTGVPHQLQEDPGGIRPPLRQAGRHRGADGPAVPAARESPGDRLSRTG